MWGCLAKVVVALPKMVKIGPKYWVFMVATVAKAVGTLNFLESKPTMNRLKASKSVQKQRGARFIPRVGIKLSRRAMQQQSKRAKS